MLSVLAKLGNAQMLGKYALGLAITAPLMLLAGLQLNSVQITDAKEEFSFGDYFALRLLSASAAVGLTAIIAVSRFEAETATVILLVACAKAIDSVCDVFLAAWQQVEKMRLVASIWMVNAAMSLLFAAVAMYWRRSIILATTGSICGSIVALSTSLLFVPSVRCGNGGASWPLIRPRILRRLIVVASPIGVVGALLSLNTNVPRYFVQHYLGERSLGVFAAAAYPMVIAETLVNSLTQSVSPRMAFYFAKCDAASIRRLLYRLTMIGTLTAGAAVGVALICGKKVMALLYGAEYATNSEVFVLLVTAMAIRYTYVFIGVAITSMRRFTVQLYLRVVMVLCLTGISALLTSQVGLPGAALALVVMAIVEGAAWVAVAYVYLFRASVSDADIEGARPVQPTMAF